MVTDCDGCPLRTYDPDYGRSYDSGWNCGHPDADEFRIADEGGFDWRYKYGDSVVLRIKKLFPDRCPLIETIAANAALHQDSNSNVLPKVA
jgi:hypothetical protein